MDCGSPTYFFVALRLGMMIFKNIFIGFIFPCFFRGFRGKNNFYYFNRLSLDLTSTPLFGTAG